MQWIQKTFDELTPLEVYRILKARSEVFIVEQDCPYLDPDGLDLQSTHLWAREGERIAAYCRITPKGTRYPELSIGRVITTGAFRGKNLGRELMQRAIRHITQELGEPEIRISGQAYLRRFYEELGFQAVSDEYMEDRIPHLEMLYQHWQAPATRTFRK